MEHRLMPATLKRQNDEYEIAKPERRQCVLSRRSMSVLPRHAEGKIWLKRPADDGVGGIHGKLFAISRNVGIGAGNEPVHN